MANAAYDEMLKIMFGRHTHSQIDADTDNFKVTLLDEADHTVNLATDVDEADLTAAGEVAVSGNLASADATVASNIITFDSNDIVISTVSGDQFESVVLWKDSGVAATSPLLFNYDTGTGLPFTPSGGDITVAPNVNGWAQVDGTP